MDLLAVITAVLTLLAGIGVFLIACTMMSSNHIQRLSLGICEPQAGTEYISLAQNSERVADHLINVAKTIRQLQ